MQKIIWWISWCLSIPHIWYLVPMNKHSKRNSNMWSTLEFLKNAVPPSWLCLLYPVAPLGFPGILFGRFLFLPSMVLCEVMCTCPTCIPLSFLRCPCMHWTPCLVLIPPFHNSKIPWLKTGYIIALLHCCKRYGQVRKISDLYSLNNWIKHKQYWLSVIYNIMQQIMGY